MEKVCTVTVLRDVCYDEEHGLLLDLFLPNGEKRPPVFVFFHGGGFDDLRQKDMGEPLAMELAEQGILCVTPAYRHYPKAKFPEFIEDGARAVAWVKEHISQYAPAGKLFVGGHSAGAHLSMLLCFDDRYLRKWGVDGKKDVAGYLFASGQPTTHMNVLRESGTDPRAVVVDERAPLYYVRQDGPPLQILCTDHDIQNRLEQTALLAGTLRHFGYASPIDYRIVEGYGHNNYLFPDEKRPEKPSVGSRLMGEFLRKYGK